MAVILFYSTFSRQSRDTESLMIAFKQQGNRVLALSQAEGSEQFLEPQGIESYSYVISSSNGVLHFLRHALYLIKFCWRNKVDIVYSHLEPANFVAVLSQSFIKADVYVCRHHVDLAALHGFQNSITYKLTYSLAKKIIVVSKQAVEYMIKSENIKKEKILKINLGYNFSLYPAPDMDVVRSLRQKARSELTLITISRLDKFKRADLSIDVLKNLLDKGVDANLFLLGSGEEEVNLKALVSRLNLTDRVFMPGHVTNVMDYLAASDFMLHPSMSESSCVTVKEAGLCKLPVIVCEGVGDFDDFIVNKKNGFAVPVNDFVEQSTAIIFENWGDKTRMTDMGLSLKQKVYELFSIENVIRHYNALNIEH